MRLSFRHLACLSGLFTLMLATSASARFNYPSAFSARYPNSALNSMSCSLCHPNFDTGKWNAYGNAVKSKSGTIDQRLAAVEPIDSDQDGFPNLAEITAGTDPSNKAVHPAPTPTPTPRPTPTPTPKPTPTPTPRPTPTPTPKPTPTPAPTPLPTPLPTWSYEIQFMERMIDLHEVGIRFAAVAQAKAAQSELRTFAGQYGLRLKAQRDIMLGWLRTWYRLSYTPRLYPGFTVNLAAFAGQSGAEFDSQFMEFVMGLDNQDMYLAYQGGRLARHTEVRSMCLTMVDYDRADLSKLRHWLEAWGVNREHDDD